MGGPYVGFSGSFDDDCEELADRLVLELDDVPDRPALEVDDVADSFRKAPKISFNGPASASVELGGSCKLIEKLSQTKLPKMHSRMKINNCA